MDFGSIARSIAIDFGSIVLDRFHNNTYARSYMEIDGGLDIRSGDARRYMEIDMARSPYKYSLSTALSIPGDDITQSIAMDSDMDSGDDINTEVELLHSAMDSGDDISTEGEDRSTVLGLISKLWSSIRYTVLGLISKLWSSIRSTVLGGTHTYTPLEIDGIHTYAPLEIDGFRYLCIGSGVDEYYISNQPQLIRGQRIPIKNKGLRAFKIDRGDSDYFDLVALGIIISDEELKDYVGYPVDDFGNTWVGGDKMLFDEISKKVGLELEEGREIVCLPPFVFKYPKKKPSKLWPPERLLAIFLNHAIRLCVDMRNASGMSRTQTEKRIHPSVADLGDDGQPDESHLLEDSSDDDYSSDYGSDLEFYPPKVINSYELHQNKNLSTDSGGCLKIHGHRYLAFDGESGKYYISEDPQPIGGGQRIPSTYLAVCMFKIDHGGECYDLVSLGLVGRDVSGSRCFCGDSILHQEVLNYFGAHHPWELMNEIVYVPPLVVKYPKNKQPLYNIVMKTEEEPTTGGV